MSHVAMYVSEIVGTFILLLLGDGVVAAVILNKSKAKDSGWIVITGAWGFAVAIAAYSVGWVGGAHLNPAVTIGLAVAGMFDWSLVIGYIICQIIGAFLGGVFVYITYKQQFDATDDPTTKLGVFSTIPVVYNPIWNFITEVIGTIVLVFGIMALTNGNTGLGSMGTLMVGILVFGIGLSLGGPTGYAINPARDLGPRIAHAVLPIKGKGSSDWGYAWIPVVAPCIGGAIGALLYKACLSIWI